MSVVKVSPVNSSHESATYIKEPIRHTHKTCHETCTILPHYLQLQVSFQRIPENIDSISKNLFETINIVTIRRDHIRLYTHRRLIQSEQANHYLHYIHSHKIQLRHP